MNRELEERLAQLSSELKSGEQKELIIDQTRLTEANKEKLIAKIHQEYPKEGKIITFPFTANYAGSDAAVIRGDMDKENIKKAKRSGRGFSLVKSFVSKAVEEFKKDYESIKKSEDDLDSIYVDEKGRDYQIIDGYKTYLDERGFDYYLKYDLDGHEYAWVKLSDGSIGTFLDSERTVLKIGDKAYYFDGAIHWDQEMDTFYPHR